MKTHYFKCGQTDKGLWISINDESINIPIETAHKIAGALLDQAKIATERTKAEIAFIKSPPVKTANIAHRVYNRAPDGARGRFNYARNKNLK